MEQDLITVENLCALVNGGQHLFFFLRVLDCVFFVFFSIAVGRVCYDFSDFQRDLYFSGIVKIGNSHFPYYNQVNQVPRGLSYSSPHFGDKSIEIRG